MNTLLCERCGTSFREYPYRLKTRRFCSPACTNAWQRESGIHKGANGSAWKGGGVELTCDECHFPFRTKTAQARHYRARFCNRICKGKWMSKNKQGENSPSWKGVAAIRVPCNGCGTIIRPKNIARKTQRRYFCSRKCQGAWASRNRVGENHPRWRGGDVGYYGPDWQRQQRKARERDGYRCRICGTKKGQRGQSLDVHHIKPFREFGYVYGENDHYLQANVLTNLITLCPKCHKAVEKGRIPCQPFLF